MRTTRARRGRRGRPLGLAFAALTWLWAAPAWGQEAAPPSPAPVAPVSSGALSREGAAPLPGAGALPRVDPALPPDALLGLQELELSQRPRLRVFGGLLTVDDDERYWGGVEASRLLSEQVRLHASAGWAHFTSRIPALVGNPGLSWDYVHGQVWLRHEVAGLGRRLILEPGLDLWSADGREAVLSPRLQATFKVLDERLIQTRVVASGAYRNLWNNPIDALAFKGRVSDLRVEIVNEFGLEGELQLVQLAFAAGYRRYELGGSRIPGGGYQSYGGQGERYFSARCEVLVAEDPVRILVSYELYRSRLDLGDNERGLIPIIEDSLRHTLGLRVEGRLTHTLSAWAEGFLAGDPKREIDFARANGGRVGFRWQAGLRLTCEASYGYNSESITGASGEVHEAELALTYVF